MQINPVITVPDAALEALLRRFLVRELSVFGSAVTPRFGPDSDVT